MEPKFKTSFIPKKPVATTTRPSVSGRGISFIMLLSTVIFLVSVLFGLGVFMYKLKLQGDIDAQATELQKVTDAFDPPFIARASRLNKRIIAANRILDRHLSPSQIFELLEQSTLQTISFNTFVFNNNVEGKINIEGSGVGQNFSSIVLQSDEFGRTGSMRDVLFSGLERNQSEGNVSFKFEATLDPQLILYSKNIQPVTISAPESTSDDEQPDVGVFGEPQSNGIQN